MTRKELPSNLPKQLEKMQTNLNEACTSYWATISLQKYLDTKHPNKKVLSIFIR